MVPSAPTTLFEATIPSNSLRPLSRALVALSKIGDEVCFEASASKVMLSSINQSKSAFGIANLDKNTFFTSYDCPGGEDASDITVHCKMQTRLLLSIFKARNVEASENKESSPESCQIKVIDNPQNGVCRFIIRLLCVVKTHQLTYSPAQSLYAFGDRSQCTQHFVVPSKLAKEYLDHFQSRIEEVDIYVDGDKLIWNGFTEGFTGDDSQLLKQPLQTQVSLSTGELDDHQLHEGVHILLSVRDFKAAVALAESLGVPVEAMYSTPGKPFIISVDKEPSGIRCEFLIATVSDGGPSVTSSIPTKWNTQSRQGSIARQASVQREQSIQKQAPVQREEPMMVDNDSNIGWGVDREMSPARSAKPIEDEEDIYGEPMQMDQDDEEIPPTQQERYQGIFEA